MTNAIAIFPFHGECSIIQHMVEPSAESPNFALILRRGADAELRVRLARLVLRLLPGTADAPATPL